MVPVVAQRCMWCCGRSARAKGGAVADVKPLGDVGTVENYHAVVIGSAVRAGRVLPEARDFVLANRSALRKASARASGGSGVFLVRDKRKNDWAGPAFYTIGEASFGFQIGGDASEVVLVAMTERGVRSFL